MRRTLPKVRLFEESIYTAISTKVVGKIVHATISKGNMGMINTLFLTLWLLLPLSFSTRKHMSMAFRAILSNFFEEQ